MKCPVCGDALTSMTYLKVPIGMCNLCEAVWVSPQHMDAIKRTPRAFDDREIVKVRLLREWRVIEGEQASPWMCPGCGLRLIRTHYKDIPSLILDRCPRGCGLWLAKDSLQKIQILENDGG